MTKAKNKNQKFWILLTVFLFLMTILLMGGVYVSSLRSDMMGQVTANVLALTQQKQETFSSFVAQDRERVHSFATYFSTTESTNENVIRSRMRAFDEVEAVYTVVNKETGRYFRNSDNGEARQMDPDTLDGYQQLNESGVRESYVNLGTGEMMFGYYEAFEFADGVPGLFQKGYDIDEIIGRFAFSFYDNQGHTYVVNLDGDILLRQTGSGEHSFYNIFDSIDFVPQNEAGRQELMSALTDERNKSTGMLYFQRDGETYVYTYMPVSGEDGIYIISVVPEDVIRDEANHVINSSRVTLFVVGIMVVTLAVTVLVMWQISRSIRRRDDEIAYQQQQYNILTTFLSENTDAVYIMMEKKTSQVEYVSPNVERVMGIPQEEVMQSIRALRQANYKSDEGITVERVKGMKAGDFIGPLDTDRINPQTKERGWFRETVFDTQIQDREKIIIYISDRTREQKIQDTLAESLEAVKVANQAKTTFLSSMSHDIRTPMNAIMGMIALIKEDVDDRDRVLEYTHRMDAASRHLLELINNILDMNKIESGSVTLSIGELNMAEFIDSINTIIRPQAKAKDQTFRIVTSDITNEHLLGDSTRLSQILINILSNAVKYTQDGGEIEFSVQQLPQVLNNYSRFRFIVKDNGQGMSEEYQKVMFDPFTREQNTTTNRIQGTGLGMAITKSLVDLMGGTIQVDSKVGEGSTFTVELELRVQDKVADRKFWKEHHISRMLLADDDPDSRESVVRAMAKTGVEVDCATDGGEAVGIIKEGWETGKHYDLILLDWKMPGMDGMQTARLIYKNSPKKIPVLFFTAYDWADIEEEARELGVKHFLPKPFFITTFQEAIRRMMSSREEEEKKKEEPKSILAGKHILVAEDIEVNRMILEKILATRGATCDMAEDGQKVVEKFNASEPGTYDMVFMDVQMPNMNGYDATRAIRASEHPEGKSIPIIAMTANAFADDVREALESGMDAHVSKPVVIDQVEQIIKKVLESKAEEKTALAGQSS